MLSYPLFLFVFVGIKSMPTYPWYVWIDMSMLWYPCFLLVFIGILGMFESIWVCFGILVFFWYSLVSRVCLRILGILLYQEFGLIFLESMIIRKCLGICINLCMQWTALAASIEGLGVKILMMTSSKLDIVMWWGKKWGENGGTEKAPTFLKTKKMGNLKKKDGQKMGEMKKPAHF